MSLEESALTKINQFRVKQSIERMFRLLIENDEEPDIESGLTPNYIDNVPYTATQIETFVEAALNIYVHKKTIDKFQVREITVTRDAIRIKCLLYFIGKLKPLRLLWNFKLSA